MTMMPNYKFDAERWLRNVAEVQSHRAGAGPAMVLENMLKCADEIHRLRAENDTLRNEARVYRAQCDMRDEWRDKIEGELAALREAVAWERECSQDIRPLVAWADLYVRHGEDYVDAVADDLCTIQDAARAEVDRLIGEEE